MTDYRTFFDKEYIYAYDLDGKEVTVTIERIEGRELTAAGGRKAKKPVLFFKGSPKGLALNATNGKTIASLYGNKVEEWVGRKVTMFPTTTSMGGETVDCIRIKNIVPAASLKAAS